MKVLHSSSFCEPVVKTADLSNLTTIENRSICVVPGDLKIFLKNNMQFKDDTGQMGASFFIYCKTIKNNSLSYGKIQISDCHNMCKLDHLIIPISTRARLFSEQIFLHCIIYKTLDRKLKCKTHILCNYRNIV